jgi:hypothetical protein
MSDDEVQDDTPDNELKRRFGEALARKNKAAQAWAATEQARPKAKGGNGAQGRQRLFRRKSG